MLHRGIEARIRATLTRSGVVKCRDLFEPRLSQAHATIVIPLDHSIFLVRLFDCAQFASRLFEVTRNLQKELPHLRDLGLLKNKQRPDWKFAEDFQLNEYLELSDSGRDHVLQSDAHAVGRK